MSAGGTSKQAPTEKRLGFRGLGFRGLGFRGLDGHLPRLLQQLRSAECAHEGLERGVARRRNLDFDEERVAKFEFEMLERAWARMA